MTYIRLSVLLIQILDRIEFQWVVWSVGFGPVKYVAVQFNENNISTICNQIFPNSNVVFFALEPILLATRPPSQLSLRCTPSANKSQFRESVRPLRTCTQVQYSECQLVSLAQPLIFSLCTPWPADIADSDNRFSSFLVCLFAYVKLDFKKDIPDSTSGSAGKDVTSTADDDLPESAKELEPDAAEVYKEVSCKE